MDTNKSQPSISISELTHTYNKWGNKIVALSDVTVDFFHGQLVMLLGPNGAGKSTLLHLLTGELSGKTTGTIKLNGKDLLNNRQHANKKHVAIIQQDPKLSSAADLTVIEHFALSETGSGSCWLRPVSIALRRTVVEMLKPFGLEKRLDIPVGLLSGGERQILALLMARLRKVDVLLLDEPIAALDSGNAKACLNEVKEVVADEEVSAIMVTHDFHIACEYGDRLIGLVDGKIVFDYSNDEKDKFNPFTLWKTLENNNKNVL